jgi:hypothetical protein
MLRGGIRHPVTPNWAFCIHTFAAKATYQARGIGVLSQADDLDSNSVMALRDVLI